MILRNNFKNNEKILKKSLNLMDKGYSIEYCSKKFSAYKKEIVPFIDILRQIEQLKSIVPDKDFSKATLNKIYKSSEKQNEKKSIKSNSVTLKPRRAILRLALVFLSLFIFLTFPFIGAVYASEKSLPGQTLYNVKKSIETVELAFTPYTSQGTVHLKFLNKRLAEADTIFDNNIETFDETMNKLLADIDYEYNKCNERKILSKSEGEIINKKINDIKMQYQKKYEKQDNIKSNIENQHPITNNINETTGSNNTSETAIGNDGSNMDDGGNNTNETTGNNSEDTETTGGNNTSETAIGNDGSNMDDGGNKNNINDKYQNAQGK